MTEKEIDEWDAEYSQRYVLYNAISDAVDDIEGRRGGLRAPEVWREVLKLEERLPTAPRADKFISRERTRLMREFSKFASYRADGKAYYETKEDRSNKEVERSVMCVLLALGLRLASYPDDMPNPYERIMERIREMALQCEDLEMVAAFANEYYNGEDDEENLGNYVPEEDVLKPYVKPKLTKELQAINNRMSWVFGFFSGTLDNANVVSEEWNAEGYGAIWDDLLMMEPILRALAKPTGIKNTLQADDINEGNKDYIVKTDEYNLHLVLNIIGVMIEQGVVRSNASSTRKLFFAEQSKDKYFQSTKFKAFGTSDSAFDSEEMYNSIVDIINKHKIKKKE